MDRHCRVTVVGERRQVDLAVPATAPITTYVDTLARLCGQETNDLLPPAWSLATATSGPFAPERSLAELEITDGQVLYLRDVIAEEYAEPVVYDVRERVAEVAEGMLRRHWNARTRTVTAMAAGLGWLAATLIVLALGHQVTGAVLADLAVFSGLALLALAWTAAARRWPVPLCLRQVLALSAVPALALAYWMLAGSHLLSQMEGRHAIMTAGGLSVAATACGALIGAFLAFAASPGITTCASLLATLLAALLGSALAMLKATPVESAAVVAVASYVLLTIAPATVNWIVTFASRTATVRMVAEDDDPEATAAHAAATLLVLWSGTLAALIAAALVVLAASRSPYAAAAAGCLGIALLLRAGAVRLAAGVVPVGIAGEAGLFTLLLVGPGHLGWRTWIAPLLAGLIAIGLLLYGFRQLLRRAEMPPMPRPRWLTGFSWLLAGGSAALVVATFADLGHQL